MSRVIRGKSRPSAASRNKRGINKTDWVRIDRELYDSCLDARDYREKRAQLAIKKAVSKRPRPVNTSSVWFKNPIRAGTADLGVLSQPTTGYPAVTSESPRPSDEDVSVFMLTLPETKFNKNLKKFLQCVILTVG